MSELLRKVGARYNLSQTDTGPMTCCPQLVALEFKGPDGCYNESSIQLGIWMAAGLEKLSQLQALTEPSAVGPIPPILGLTVVGHFWSLHLLCKVDDSTVVSVEKKRLTWYWY